MVSLLIISHSAKLAEGIKEFVGQATHNQITIIAAGGRTDGGLGTSVDRILEGLREAESPEGILALVDLSGAVIALETALEMYSGVPVQISDGPIVEGAFLAGVEAASGASLAEAAAAALQGRELVKVQG